MAFDTEAAKSWETKLFGGVKDGAAYGEHFSASLLAVLKELSGEYPEAARLVEVYDNAETGVNSEGKQDLVKLMSCMTFLSGEETSDVAQHWRLGNSTMDGDVGSLMAYLMARVMKDNLGIEDVEFYLGVDEISGNGHGFFDFNFLYAEAGIDEMCTGESAELPALPALPLVTYEPSSGGPGGGPNGGGNQGGPSGGNQGGPSGGDQGGQSPETPAEATYVVQAGDCLWNIAARKLGSGLKWKALFEANQSAIKNPDVIYVGQTLVIPD